MYYVAKEIKLLLNIRMMHLVDDECDEYIVIAQASHKYRPTGAGYISENEISIINQFEYRANKWNGLIEELDRDVGNIRNLWDRKVAV